LLNVLLTALASGNDALLAAAAELLALSFPILSYLIVHFLLF
jgi:hypothetical protein